VQRGIAVLAHVLRDPVAGRRWRVHFDVEAFLGQFRGHVLEAVQHPHANHVVKRLLDTMPSERVAFVAQELAGHAVWASRHKFGCRAVIRLVRHSKACGWAGDCAKRIMHEVLSSAAELSMDEFGKFVMEEIIENGIPEHREFIVSTLHCDLARNACHEHASFLIQRALRGVGGAAVAHELVARAGMVAALARSQFGRYVLWDLARMPAHAQAVGEALKPLAEELQHCKQGRKLIADLSADKSLVA